MQTNNLVKFSFDFIIFNIYIYNYKYIFKTHIKFLMTH